MKDMIFIEVEIANSCFGLVAKFYKGKSLEACVPVKETLDEMNRLTEYFNNTCGCGVAFTTR